MVRLLQRALVHPKFLKFPLIFLVTLLVLGFLTFTPEGLLGKADAIGYAVCHRMDLRSYHIGDRPLPLCVRCTGMYLGAMVGLAFQWVSSKRCAGMPPRRVTAVLALLVLAFAVDGINSYLTLFPRMPSLYSPQHTLRLITGTGMGLVISAMLYPAFQQTIWQEVSQEAAIKNLRQLFILFLLTAGVDGLVLTQNPFWLYPLALISAGGVLTLLTMIYTMLWVIVLRHENRYANWRELSLFLWAGFGFALLQIILIDIGRFLLTGTWDGFHIG
ncbi:MAG: DUF2085 domain-containing protein [Anaerolineales bacterium]|nr:DUF2085 domain-containing protein [Anaerolineales bacterium]